MTRWSLLPLAVLIGPLGLVAQVPGESVSGSRSNFRQEYLDHTYREISKALDGWTKAIEKRDAKPIRKLLVDDLLFSPLDGYLVRGQTAVDSLANYLTRVSAFGVSPFDFDASGAMASVYASVYYQLVGPGASQTVIADAAIILVQRGSDWKIRSYVERPRPAPDP